MLGLVGHIDDSGVAGNQLRSSRRPDFLAVLVLSLPHVPIYYFSVLSGYFGDIVIQGVEFLFIGLRLELKKKVKTATTALWHFLRII